MPKCTVGASLGSMTGNQPCYQAQRVTVEGSRMPSLRSKELVCQRNWCAKGIGAYDTLCWESGVHCVQRVPAMEASGCEHCSGS